MSAFDLVELDSLAITAIINDEVDIISPSQHGDVEFPGSFMGVPLNHHPSGGTWSSHRGGAKMEMRMDRICCGNHGLSLLVVHMSHPPFLAFVAKVAHSLLADWHQRR